MPGELPIQDRLAFGVYTSPRIVNPAQPVPGGGQPQWGTPGTVHVARIDFDIAPSLTVTFDWGLEGTYTNGAVWANIVSATGTSPWRTDRDGNILDPLLPENRPWVRWASTLGNLPRHVRVWAIPSEDCRFGLSIEVE